MYFFFFAFKVTKIYEKLHIFKHLLRKLYTQLLREKYLLFYIQKYVHPPHRVQPVTPKSGSNAVEDSKSNAEIRFFSHKKQQSGKESSQCGQLQ